jgi:Zn finger protein HypA/HybF involved in hydrogenase expression
MRGRTWTDEQFIEAVQNSKSIANVLRCIGLEDRNAGSNYYTVKENVKRLNLNTDHWVGQAHNKGTHLNGTKKYKTEDILIENSPYSSGATSNLKKRLIKEGILESKCNVCGMSNIWQGKELVLVLDHVNGIKNDNRRENLRLICPNCNSQTATFAGKNSKINRFTKEVHICKQCNKSLRTRRDTGLCRPCFLKNHNVNRGQKTEKTQEVKIYKCRYCDKLITSRSDMCLSCAQRVRYGRLDRPTKEQLLEDIKELGYCGTGRKYTVSDNAIRKWMK